MMARSLALLAAVLLAQGAPAAGAEPAPALGRLFHTPEERAALERRRQSDSLETGGALRLDGIVVRSSGGSTVWINGQPQAAGSAPPAGLRVGATLDPATGRVSDGLAGGEIRVRPAAPPRPETRR